MLELINQSSEQCMFIHNVLRIEIEVDHSDFGPQETTVSITFTENENYSEIYDSLSFNNPISNKFNIKYQGLVIRNLILTNLDWDSNEYKVSFIKLGSDEFNSIIRLSQFKSNKNKVDWIKEGF